MKVLVGATIVLIGLGFPSILLWDALGASPDAAVALGTGCVGLGGVMLAVALSKEDS